MLAKFCSKNFSNLWTSARIDWPAQWTCHHVESTRLSMASERLLRTQRFGSHWHWAPLNNSGWDYRPTLTWKRPGSRLKRSSARSSTWQPEKGKKGPGRFCKKMGIPVDLPACSGIPNPRTSPAQAYPATSGLIPLFFSRLRCAPTAKNADIQAAE